MSYVATPGAVAPVSERTPSWVKDFRLIPRVETYPRVVEVAQTVTGKAVLLSLFGLALYYATSLHYLRNPRWKAQICALVIITALPKYRRLLLTACTLLWAFGIWW